MDFGSLTQKKGPLPVWAWALITSVILFLLYRHFSKGSTSSSSSSASNAASADGNVASVPTPDSSSTVTPSESFGVGTPVQAPDNTGVGETTVTPWWLTPDPTATPDPIPDPLSSPNPIKAPAPGDNRVSPSGWSPTRTPPVKPAAKPTAQVKSIIPGITGAIKSQKVLPSGAKLVTLQSGRVIEQAPGKKAYVVKK